MFGETKTSDLNDHFLLTDERLIPNQMLILGHLIETHFELIPDYHQLVDSFK